MATEATTSPAKPLHRIKVSSTIVTIWPKQRITIERLYFTKDSESKYARSLRRADLGDLVDAIEQTRHWFKDNPEDAE